MPERRADNMSDEEIKTRYPTLGLDIIVLDELKKGSLVSAPMGIVDGEIKTVHYDIKHMRNCVEDIYKAYSRKASRTEMFNILEKHKKRRDDDNHDFFSRLENFGENEKTFKVIKRVDKKSKGEVILTFKEVPQEDKKKIVKSIVRKLVNKVTPEQLKIMFEQAIIKLNDMDSLKKVDKALKKKKPKLKEKTGCFKLVVDDVDVFIVG